MKEHTIDLFKKLLSERYLFLSIVLLIILAIIASISIGLSIHFVDQRMVSHYSAFGVASIYYDQPIYLIVFILFELIVAVLHSLLTVKFLIIKGRSLAFLCVWTGIGVVLMGWVTALAVLNLGKLL